MYRSVITGVLIFGMLLSGFAFGPGRSSSTAPDFLEYRTDPAKAKLKFYWKNDKGELFRSIGNLKNWLAARNEKLVFAMNGGMYTEDRSPLGLFIENGKTIRPLNTKKGSGNFYMKPNGVFYVTHEGKAFICATDKFKADKKISFATQSGPVLLVNGEIRTDFTPGSKNLNIRNGAGILPDGKVLFVMSKGLVNFYDFAAYFKKAGCKEALYFDGFVSRMYFPAKAWEQTGGDFGVMIGETAK